MSDDATEAATELFADLIRLAPRAVDSMAWVLGWMTGNDPEAVIRAITFWHMKGCP